MRFRRSSAILLVAAATLVACSSSSAPTASDDVVDGSDLTLADVRRAIAANGASWSAGANTVTALPRAARTGMLGVPMSEVSEERVTILEESTNENDRVDLPAAFDWRDRDGKNFVSPMLNQGRCGSCVAFAAVATFETQLNIAANDTSSPWQLSPQYLFSCGGGGCGFGWMPESASRFLVNKGVTDNACMPYASGAHGDDIRCNTACTNASQRVMKPIGYARPSSGGASVPAVKRALLKGPLMASMVVYDDFMFYTGGVYKHVTGARAGGHAVSIVGWNDEHQSWVVRNSWGTGWGANGYFEIAWGDVSGVGERTWSLEVPPPGPYVTFSELRDGEVLSGTKSFAFSTQSVEGSTLSWTLVRGASEIVTSGRDSLDTRSVPDGTYTLRPQAATGTSTIAGPPRLVHVLNGKLNGRLSFRNINAGQVLTGTAKFDVAMISSPIPATKAGWTITNAAGEVIVNKEIGSTGALMSLGWNTTRWPNGTYTIAVTAGAGTQSLPAASIVVSVNNPNAPPTPTPAPIPTTPINQ
jgi:hypothetical protein